MSDFIRYWHSLKITHTTHTHTTKRLRHLVKLRIIVVYISKLNITKNIYCFKNRKKLATSQNSLWGQKLWGSNHALHKRMCRRQGECKKITVKSAVRRCTQQGYNFCAALLFGVELWILVPRIWLLLRLWLFRLDHIGSTTRHCLCARRTVRWHRYASIILHNFFGSII